MDPLVGREYWMRALLISQQMVVAEQIDSENDCHTGNELTECCMLDQIFNIYVM